MPTLVRNEKVNYNNHISMLSAYVDTKSDSTIRKYIATKRDFKKVKFIEFLSQVNDKHEKLLDSSNNYLKVIAWVTYPVLEKTENVVDKLLKGLEKKRKSLIDLKSKHSLHEISKGITILNQLIDANKRIQELSKVGLEAHKIDGALERGFLLISDLNDSEYLLNFNLEVRISFEDGEYVGELEDLGIIEYADTLKSVVDYVKSYIIELFDEYSITKDEDLSSELIAQKEFILSIAAKKNQ